MLTRIVTLLGFAALLAAGSANAEIPLQFTVPFDFSVGQHKMTAGTYLVKYPNSSCVLVQKTDNRQSAFVITHAVQHSKNLPPTAKMMFNRYGAQYFLAEIWAPGNDMGRQLTKSKTELEIARRATDGGELIAVRIGR